MADTAGSGVSQTFFQRFSMSFTPWNEMNLCKDMLICCPWVYVYKILAVCYTPLWNLASWYCSKPNILKAFAPTFSMSNTQDIRMQLWYKFHLQQSRYEYKYKFHLQQSRYEYSIIHPISLDMNIVLSKIWILGSTATLQFVVRKLKKNYQNNSTATCIDMMQQKYIFLTYLCWKDRKIHEFVDCVQTLSGTAGSVACTG